MNDESPVAAVKRVLAKQFDIENPSNLKVMMLIEAVKDALPPHPDATIASLRAILRSLRPDDGLDRWAIKCAREITSWLVEQSRFSAVDGFWCTVEGRLTGMLLRVTRGKDLEENPESTGIKCT